jgi:FKBP-type peptidyl-prolyl cis-trans isomerase (trigger factor)
MAGGFKRNKKAMTKREMQDQVGSQAENAIKMVQGLAMVVNQQIRNLKLETSNLAAMSIMQEEPNGVVTESSIAYIDFTGAIKNEDGSLAGNFEGGQGVGVFVDMSVHQFLTDFQKGLIGMKAGEEKTFDVKFPENYGSKELAGKTALFEVHVRKVWRDLPSRVAIKAASIQKELEAKKVAAQQITAQVNKSETAAQGA